MSSTGRVLATAVVSVDGFVADEHDEVGALFDWYGNGDVATHYGDPSRVFRVSSASAAYIEGVRDRVRTGVIGRRLFDLTDGWNGVPPAGEHVFVVTHAPPTDWEPRGTAPFTFVTDGVASAIEQALALAGGRDVSVTGGQVAGQALALGLLDELHLNVAPVVLGSGRAFLATYAGPQVVLGDPQVTVGDRVVHMVYPVTRSGVATASAAAPPAHRAAPDQARRP